MIYVSVSRELVSFYERNSSVFSQVVLVAGADRAIDLPAALKGDPLYSGSGDESLALVSGSVVPDPVICKGKSINVSLIPAGYRKLASYIDRVLKDGNAEVSINEAYEARSGNLSSDLHIVVLSISDLGRSDEGVRPMSSVPHGEVYGDSTNTADIFPVAAANDLTVSDRAGSGSAFHHRWFWFWLNRRRRWFRVKHISHSVESGTGSGGSIYYAIVGGFGIDSSGLGGGDSRFHLGFISQSTVRSDLSSASMNNTSMWSSSQMGHISYAVGGDYTDSGRRGHYATRFSGFCCTWLLLDDGQAVTKVSPDLARHGMVDSSGTVIVRHVCCPHVSVGFKEGNQYLGPTTSSTFLFGFSPFKTVHVMERLESLLLGPTTNVNIFHIF